jgi:hypothetical protein
MVAGRSWSEAVTNAVRRHVAETGSVIFTRQALMDTQLDAIMAETGSAGATPHQTLSRELQQLRDTGLLEFIDQGTYRWKGAALDFLAERDEQGRFRHRIAFDLPGRAGTLLSLPAAVDGECLQDFGPLDHLSRAQTRGTAWVLCRRKVREDRFRSSE